MQRHGKGAEIFGRNWGGSGMQPGRDYDSKIIACIWVWPFRKKI